MSDHINIDCLRAAESLLRQHDAAIGEKADELKQLRKDRVPLAERVQHCIDVLCGRATPDLFTPTPTPPADAADVPVSEPVAVESPAPPPPDVTPPLAPGETVPLDVIKATPIGDIAVIQDDPELAAIAAKLAGVEFEVVTVGELWEWADEDFAHWGGFGGAGQCGIVGALSAATVAVKPARRFGVVLEGWLEANGCRLTEVGWVSAADVPTTPAKARKRAGTTPVRTCRVCKCTEADCSQCIEKTGQPCHWVEADLCSACVEQLAHQTHCCEEHGCKYGHEDCPVVAGQVDGIGVAECEDCQEDKAEREAAQRKGDPAPEPESEAEDLTAEEEARVGAKETKSPGDDRKLRAMAQWRQRQAAGDITPTWGYWAEFTVYLADGSMVAVLYDPTWGSGVDHFEFHGQAVSETGYRSHFEDLKNGRRPKQPLEAWAKAFCEKLAGETAAKQAKAAKQRLKAPPKRTAKPKSKGKVKA